jgi:acetolactate synthase-1/2/3 large subunit
MAITTRTGAQVLVDALRIHQVDRAFCVPGESYLAVLDALYDVQPESDASQASRAGQIALHVCRQEGGAAYMAEAYGKLTGKPGICFVTRGPGATNAAIGVHTAFQDSTPMILFIGQVARGQLGREAFQEVDYRSMFGDLAKWVVQIDDAARIPELLGQAFHRACNGRPGPVVVVLPEDMLRDRVTVADAGPVIAARPYPDAAAQALLLQARKPLMIVGGAGWDKDVVARCQTFAERVGIPVAASFRCQDLFDNTHPNYVGDLGLATGAALKEAVLNADVLLVVGARLGEMTTAGYTLLRSPVPTQALIHVHLDAEEIGKVFQPRVAIVSTMAAFVEGMADWPRLASHSHTQTLRVAYEAGLQPVHGPGAVQLSEIVCWLRDTLPDDAILTNGAGNYSAWLQRFYQFRRFRTQLGPTNGSMGYGVPAAVAAKLTAPERTVVAFAGDGCFLMNGQEFATAVQYRAGIIVIVVNNGMYGTIRAHQERHYPARVSGTVLVNPDFAAYARAFGGHGETVRETGAFAPAFERASTFAARGIPAIIEIQVDPEALTPARTLSEIRDEGRRRGETGI